MIAAIRRSTRYKFVLVVLVATFTALAVAGASLLVYDQRTYRQQWMDDLLTQAEILGRATGPALAFDDPKSASGNLALLKARPNILAAVIYDARGRPVATYGANGHAVDTRLPDADGVRVDGSELVAYKRIVENKEIVGTVYLRARHEPARRLMDYLSILGAVMGLSLLVAGAVSLWLQAALTRPILAVTQAAREVMERRDFSLRVRKTTEDEVGYLVDAFNDMLAELGRRADALEASNRTLAHEAAERERADARLRTLNAELEHRVTERTAQLEAANKELEGFSYSVSHDLRAPLRGVVGFSEALIEDHGDELTPEAQRKLKIVRSEGHRMGVLINDLLAFSRLGRKSLQLGPLDMTALANATWDGMRSEHAGRTIDFQLRALPAATGDRVLLGQVWVNLLSNAAKFSTRRSDAQVTVDAISDGKEHIYFVRDNGAGFNPTYQAKLFGVFQRLHDAKEFPGTGVGLALVQRIVARHGGRVWAEGAVGKGATFYFSLPKEPGDGAV